MKTTFTSALLILVIQLSSQCLPSFSYFANGDTMFFNNTSNTLNAHFYWDFGDGSGSVSTNPLHVFPDDGMYTITLYVLDTVSGCSDFHQNTISVVRADTSSCDLYFTCVVQACGIDSCLYMTDSSVNCGWTYRNFDGGPGQNQNNIWLGGGWQSAVFVAREQAYIIDTASNISLLKEYYRTVPFSFSPTTNYQACSANFEIELLYLWNGVIATFTAMNRSATYYEWEVTGLGNPIYTYANTASQFYPYQPGERAFPWLVVLRINDTINDCGATFTRQVLIQDPYFNVSTSIDERNTMDVKCFPNPTSDILNVNVSGSPGVKIVRVFNMYGQSVYESVTMQDEFEVDINSLPRGIYSLEVIKDDAAYLTKFCKQ